MMLTRDRLTFERQITRSPIWIRAVDEFAGTPVTTGLSVTLHRDDGGIWVPAPDQPTITLSGDIAFLGLGRARDPAAVGIKRYRVRIEALGFRPDYPPPGDGVVVDVAAWSPAEPPNSVAVLFRLPMLPATTYAYPAGTPLLHGQVRDPNDDPVADAEVTATVPAVPVTERVRTDERGWFRLPLRWADGLTRVDAVKGALTGHVDVTVPVDLSTTAVIRLA